MNYKSIKPRGISVIVFSIFLITVSNTSLAFAQSTNLAESEMGAFTTFTNSIATAAPNIIGAIILLAIGYVISLVIGKAIQNRARLALTRIGFDEKISGDESSTRRTEGTSRLVAATVRWFTFLFFVVAAINLLQINELAHAMENVWLWFPNIIAAIFVTIIGILIITFASKWADKELVHNGLNKPVKTGIKATVYAMVLAISLTQLGIGTIIIPIIIGMLSVIVAIAVGYTLKEILPVIIREKAGQSSKLKVGQTVKIGNIEGTITEVGFFNIVLLNDKNEFMIIPARDLVNNVVTIKNKKNENN